MDFDWGLKQALSGYLFFQVDGIIVREEGHDLLLGPTSEVLGACGHGNRSYLESLRLDHRLRVDLERGTPLIV